jgi:hypothetical protein
MPRGRHAVSRNESNRLMTPYNKTIVATVFAAATAVLGAAPFQHHPPAWAIIATAVITPLSVFFVPNTTPNAPGALPVEPKSTPGVPLGNVQSLGREEPLAGPTTPSGVSSDRSDKIFQGGQIPAPPEPNTAKYQPLVPPVTADQPNDPTA